MYSYLIKISSEDIVIVAIDESSFSAFETQWPWPRELHGMLIERLVEEGAREILFLMWSLQSHQSRIRRIFCRCYFKWQKM